MIPYRHSQITLETHLNDDARSTAEDWSGLASAAERRKIQNRINARVYRRRKAELRRAQTSVGTLSSVCIGSSEGSIISKSQHDGERPVDKEVRNKSTDWTAVKFMEAQLSTNWVAAKVITAQSRNAAFLSRYYNNPSADLLLTLISYNAFRAIISNIEMLGFNETQLSCSASTSPFNNGASAEHLPPDMRPTILQRTIPHHPVFDAFPDPQLRDQIILWQAMHGKTDICLYLVGGSDTVGENTQGLIVWGEPYHVGSWEITEGFFREWWFLLSNCDELIRSSNRWRARRGEGPLSIQTASIKSTVL